MSYFKWKWTSLCFLKIEQCIEGDPICQFTFSLELFKVYCSARMIINNFVTLIWLSMFLLLVLYIKEGCIWYNCYQLKNKSWKYSKVTHSSSGHPSGCPSRNPFLKYVHISKGSTSEYGCWAIVVNSHRTTPKDHLK